MRKNMTQGACFRVFPKMIKKIHTHNFELEKSAEFKGGIREMYKFIAKNVRYASAAVRRRITGGVEVQFKSELTA